jgi:hypothetical protein
MTTPVAGRGGRVLGRSLLTLANVITVAAPIAADWNDSHIFNQRWPAHSRHLFTDPSLPGPYDGQAATVPWERTLAVCGSPRG